MEDKLYLSHTNNCIEELRACQNFFENIPKDKSDNNLTVVVKLPTMKRICSWEGVISLKLTAHRTLRRERLRCNHVLELVSTNGFCCRCVACMECGI